MGIELQGLGEIGQSSFQVAPAGPSDAAAIVRVGIIRSQADGFAVVSQRLFQRAEIGPNRAAIMPSGRKFRISLDGLTVVGDGIAPLAYRRKTVASFKIVF